jgi:hypothetical protein
LRFDFAQLLIGALTAASLIVPWHRLEASTLGVTENGAAGMPHALIWMATESGKFDD